MESLDFMARALALAAAGIGRVSPNPSVGAVVVRDGQVVAEGSTEPPPGRHAEIVALDEAGDLAQGAEIYVTLEPCSFESRTGPCSLAIARAGITKIHCAMVDQDPRALGRGLSISGYKGIEVELGGPHAAEAELLLEAYTHQRRTGRPFVTAKFAVSLDGKIAATNGDSRWVSSEESRAAAHELRAHVDAILVGSETILVDNPQLTARPRGELSDHQPLRVVLDARGRIDPEAAVFGASGEALVITSAASPDGWRKEIGAKARLEIAPPGPGGGIDPAAVLSILNGRGVLHVLLEGGGKIHGSFFDAGLVDKVYAVIAPLVIGGEGRFAVGGEGAARMADAWRLERVNWTHAGPDIIVQGYPTRPG